jgi:hypothetical protein
MIEKGFQILVGDANGADKANLADSNPRDHRALRTVPRLPKFSSTCHRDCGFSRRRRTCDPRLMPSTVRFTCSRSS